MLMSKNVNNDVSKDSLISECVFHFNPECIIHQFFLAVEVEDVLPMGRDSLAKRLPFVVFSITKSTISTGS